MGANADGDGYIDVRKRNEDWLFTLGTNETHPYLRMTKTSGEDLAYLGGCINGEGLFNLYNAQGARMTSMYGNETAGNLLMYNSVDQNIIRLGADSEGKGWLRVNSKTGAGDFGKS